jgi:hypothetical protein
MMKPPVLDEYFRVASYPVASARKPLRSRSRARHAGRGSTALAALVLAGAVAVAIAPRATASATPACFGAAARDAQKPCVNRSLTTTVIPSVYDAPLQPSAPCDPIRGVSVAACTFGPPRAAAVSAVALLGDSHATAWRAAVAVVAEANRWHGVSITRDNCPFTFARTPGKGRCKGWADRVRRWLGRHPEVRRVIVAANSGSGVIPANGHTQRTTKIEGYIDAWKSLPQTVRELYVLRDVPHSRNDTAGCVARALQRGRNPATRCSRPRSAALLTDEAAVAARRTDSARVKLVDLSRYMCDEQRCFPVVGGALVIKDIGHLTRTFSRTLGPFLGRAIALLRAG